MKRITFIVWLALTGLLLPACSGKTTLQYMVRGTAEQVEIRYTNQLGETREQTVKPPFDLVFEMGNEFAFQIYVTNIAQHGEVNCEVFVDGQLLGSAKGSVFAGCEGSYEKQGGDATTHFKGYDDVPPAGITLPQPEPTASAPAAQASPEDIDLGGAFIMALGNSEYGQALYLFDTVSGKIAQWTEFLGQFGCADWSPVESQLAFNSGSPSDMQLYVLSFDGNKPGSVVGLSESPARDGCPDWSPDGKLIAFDAPGPAGQTVLYVDPTAPGLPARAAFTRGDVDFNAHPDWSPDGRMVVYRSQPELTKFGLQVVTLGEEAPVTLIESDSEAYYSPVWSPDGKQVAFVVDVPGPAAHVYVMDANGENVKPVTTEALNFISSVAWTPDGTHLIFNAIEEEQGFRGIYVINVDGSGLTYLAGLPNVDLSELRLVPEGYITELPTETISIQP